MRPALAKIVQATEEDTLIKTHDTVIKLNSQITCIQDFVDRIEKQYSTLSSILEETRLKGETYNVRDSIAAIREMRESLRLYLDLYRESRISNEASKEEQSQKFDITMKAVMEVLAEYPDAREAVIRRIEDLDT